jgi:hypothetical protein
VAGRPNGGQSRESRRSSSFVTGLQNFASVPRQASTNGRERPSGGTADPDFRGRLR